MSSKKHKQLNRTIRERRKNAPAWIEEHRNDIHIVQEYSSWVHTDVHSALVELENLGFVFTPGLREQAKKDQDEKIEQANLRREEKERRKHIQALIEDGDFCNDWYSYIAGYTPGGVPYGTTWEERGIDPDLPLEKKIEILLQQETPPDDIAQKEQQRKQYQNLTAKVIKGLFSIIPLEKLSLLSGLREPWFAYHAGRDSALICRTADLPEEEIGKFYEDEMENGLQAFRISEIPGIGPEEIQVLTGDLFSRWNPAVFTMASTDAVYFFASGEELDFALRILLDAGINVVNSSGKKWIPRY